MTEIKDKQQWTAGEAAENYDVVSGYIKEPLVLRHALGHVMATDLADPKHLMDFEYAENNMPKNRIAGYQAEVFGYIYQVALEKYPMTWKKSLETAHLFSDFHIRNEEYAAAALLDAVVDRARSQVFNDLKNIEENRPYDSTAPIDKELDYKFLGKPDDGSEVQQNHLKGRVKYTQNFHKILWPSIKEVEYHMKKAEEFCEKFKNTHGKYPSQLTDNQLSALPLTDFAIEHQFPEWLKNEWQLQQTKWTEAIKSSSDQTHHGTYR